MKMRDETDDVYGKFDLEKENYICIFEPYLSCPYFLFDFRKVVEILYLFTRRLQIVVHFLFMIVHDLEVSGRKWKRRKE